MNKVKMKVNPRIIEHLGSDLITSAAVAVVELIKNSIDAHSKRVNIQFFDGIGQIEKNDKMLVPLDDDMFFLLKEKVAGSNILLIEDIGIGMNAVQLQEGYLNIGTDIKYKDYENTNLGEKGIGRLAAQCLGKKLILETASSDDKQRKVIFIDWNALINSDKIDEFEIPYYELSKMAEAYTRIWIIDVKKDELINEPLQLGLFDDNKEESVREALSGTHYDVVIDKIAYCSNDIKYVMDVIDCDKYIYMSSTSVYNPKHINTVEADFDGIENELIWCDRKAFPYEQIKRQAECALWQQYPEKNWIAVRYPFAIGKDDYTKRLLFYVEHTMKSIPMNIDNVDYQMSYIRSDEAGKFLTFLVDKDVKGAINGASDGTISIKEIIEYVEEKTGARAIIDNSGEDAPYNGEPEYSICTDKAKELGYQFTELKDWIYELLDYYI